MPIRNARGVLAKESMTFDEFVEWHGGDTYAEWVNNRAILLSSECVPHRRLVGFLFAVLNAYVEVNGLGAVIVGPYLMHLKDVPSGRTTDVLFVARDREDRSLTQDYLDSPADLAVEILSSSSFRADPLEKLAEYERAGVREYWLIEPDANVAEFHVLGADGRYVRASVGPDNIFRSRVVNGFCLRVDWLWQSPLPKLVDLMPELGLL